MKQKEKRKDDVTVIQIWIKMVQIQTVVLLSQKHNAS